MGINPDAIRTFYDPHPGFLGALISIPSAVLQVARRLEGQQIPLGQAVAKIRTVTTGKVEVQDGWISLKINEAGGTIHMFRVIRFR